MHIEMIDDGFCRIALENPDLNAYIIADKSGLALINPGHTSHRDQFDEALAELGYTREDIQRTIATSWRPQVLLGVDNFASATHFAFAEELFTPAVWGDWLDQEKQRVGELSSALGLPEEPFGALVMPIQNGDIWSAGDFRFEIIHSPGPDAGHILLREVDQNWMFGGEIAFDGLPLVSDVEVYIQQLDRALELEPLMVFPNHGDPEVRGKWALARTSRFLHNFLSNVTSALVEKPTLKDWVTRDLGFEPPEDELKLEMLRVKPFFEELVRAGHLIKEGEGLEATFKSRMNQPRRTL